MARSIRSCSWDLAPFPFTDENAQRPERIGSTPAAGVRFLGSYGTLGTACAVATRAIGFLVIASETSPYIGVMFGPHNRRRLFIIRMPTSREAAPVDIDEA